MPTTYEYQTYALGDTEFSMFIDYPHRFKFTSVDVWTS